MRLSCTLLLALWVGVSGCATGDGPAPDGTDDSIEDSASGDGSDTISENIDSWGTDWDGDGWSGAEGDCDDSLPSVNPGAWDDPDNDVDDDCDTVRDNPVVDCDCDGPSLAEAIDLCDARFLRLATDTSPVDPAASAGRGIREHYGDPGNDLGTRYGCSYALLSTGLIDPTTGVGEDRQPGYDFYNPTGDPSGDPICLGLEPDPDPAGGGGVGICDTQQLILELTAPTNAVGFSFDFVYLSTEYPEWLDQGFNDTFYAILYRPSTGETLNISFDEYDAEIEVDNAFFEDPPETSLDGTGYTDTCTNVDSSVTLCGSSTGWLRTSWNVDPGEEFTLTFSIHDEGDGAGDSTVILDNFQWSIDAVDPGTIII